MKEGPDIALIGSLIGDPARANMLVALMSGRALTASELATEAGVTVQTTSSHLSRLESGGLIIQRKQGRHRYFALADDEVGSVLESIMGLASQRGHMRVRTGPKEPALRKARVCYNHLAGEFGVQMLESMVDRKLIRTNAEALLLTKKGREFVENFGIDLAGLEGARRPLCKSCLDWSARRSHMAGSLGTAFLNQFYALKWARRGEGTRAVIFSATGEKEFQQVFKARAPR